jgi:hypothetical protein
VAIADGGVKPLKEWTNEAQRLQILKLKRLPKNAAAVLVSLPIPQPPPDQALALLSMARSERSA